MEALELPRRNPQQVVAFCKYGETAQQALASVTASVNAYMQRDPGEIAIETISHTVTQLADPVPLVPGIGGGEVGFFVVTALATFRILGRERQE